MLTPIRPSENQHLSQILQLFIYMVINCQLLPDKFFLSYAFVRTGPQNTAFGDNLSIFTDHMHFPSPPNHLHKHTKTSINGHYNFQFDKVIIFL